MGGIFYLHNEHFEKGKKDLYAVKGSHVTSARLKEQLVFRELIHACRSEIFELIVLRWDLIFACMSRRNSFIPLALRALCYLSALSNTGSLYLCLWMSFREVYEFFF